jgi:hypothetical protein
MAENAVAEQEVQTVTLSPQMNEMKDRLAKAAKARQGRVGLPPLDSPDQPIDSMDLARPGEEPQPEPEKEPEPEQAQEPEAEPEVEAEAKFEPTDRQKNIARNFKISDEALAAMPQKAVEAMEQAGISISTKQAELGRKVREAETHAAEPPAEKEGETPSTEGNGKLPESFTQDMWGTDEGAEAMNSILKAARLAESRVAALEKNIEQQETETLERETASFYDKIEDSMKDVLGHGGNIMPEQKEAREKLEDKADMIMVGAKALGLPVPSTTEAMQEALMIVGADAMREAAKAETREKIQKRSGGQIPRTTGRASARDSGGDEKSRAAARINAERARRGI